MKSENIAQQRARFEDAVFGLYCLLNVGADLFPGAPKDLQSSLTRAEICRRDSDGYYVVAEVDGMWVAWRHKVNHGGERIYADLVRAVSGREPGMWEIAAIRLMEGIIALQASLRDQYDIQLTVMEIQKYCDFSVLVHQVREAPQTYPAADVTLLQKYLESAVAYRPDLAADAQLPEAGEYHRFVTVAFKRVASEAPVACAA